MTLTSLTNLRRRFFSDLAVVTALAAVVGVEAASLASAADELWNSPSGLVLDAGDDAPAGLAIGEPERAPLVDDRLAAGEATSATAHTL